MARTSSDLWNDEDHKNHFFDPPRFYFFDPPPRSYFSEGRAYYALHKLSIFSAILLDAHTSKVTFDDN